MGWTGYTNYSGDDTQTQHITFYEWAKLPCSSDTISEWLCLRKTKIPKEYLALFKKSIPVILSKMNYNKFWDEEKAIQWQMLLCLLLDNKIKIPKIVKDNGILAIEYLLGEHSSEFDNPGLRRKHLKKLLKKVSKNASLDRKTTK